MDLDLAERQKNEYEARVLLQNAQLEKLSRDKLVAVQLYEERLSSSQALLDEFVQRRDVDVRDLELSLERVTLEFDRLVENVRYYDVDYRDAKFDGLLKGRQFEIAVARRFTVEHGCRILEWTPDKGVLFSLWSEQSNNPDLLLQAPNGQKFAIECKYRSTYARNESGDYHYPRLINWATGSQANRYREYQGRASVDVHVAIGLFGKATEPTVCILAPLEMLISESAPCMVYFSGSAGFE